MAMRIVEITEGADYAVGFWATESDRDPSEWTWNDRGNGPELIDPEGFGPFPSEEAADEWLRDYERDCANAD